MDSKQAVKELTMMLLYLTSWTERGPYSILQSWKGYDFDILNEMEEEGLISGSVRAKSVVLSEDGIRAAKELLQKYGLDEIGNGE